MCSIESWFFFSLLVALSCLNAFLCFVILCCGLLTTKSKLNNPGYLGIFFLRATCILKIRRKCKNFSVSVILYACETIMNARAMCTAFAFPFFFLTSKYWHLIRMMSQTKGILFDGNGLIKNLYRYSAKPVAMSGSFCGLNAFRSRPK